MTGDFTVAGVNAERSPMLRKIMAIIKDHGIPCEAGPNCIVVRAYMGCNEISDVITYTDRLLINGQPDNIYSWLGY